MEIRFYSIDWGDDDSLPTSVVVDVDCDEDDDIDELGAEILEEECGVEPQSFMWEFADEDEDEDAFAEEED
jgi:hypothetical protein